MKLSDILRSSILQEALQGKLTCYKINDTEINTYYGQIQQMREQNPPKRKKYEVEDIDTVPFDIPSNWKWVRWGEIINIVSAKRIHQSDWKQTGVPFYRAREIATLAEKGYVNNELFIDRDLYDKYSQNGIPLPGDLMITGVGTLGRVYIVKEGDIFYYKDASVLCIENRWGINSEYLKYCLQSDLMKNQISDNSGGTTVGTITMERMMEYIIPLPPIEEQQRIVDRVNEMLAKVDEFEKIENRLTAVKEKFPSDLREAILQAAMQGKLTEQLDTDSPVDNLLEDIRTHRDSLIANGAYKPNKKLKPLSDEDVPFDIPDSWRWIRLGYCSTYGQTKLKASDEECKSDIWSLDLEDIEKNTGRVINRCRAKDRQIGGDKVRFFKGNILYSKLRPYLLKILIADEDGICSPELIPFDMIGSINPEYILWVLRSPHVDYKINSVTYGVKMPRVGTETMINLLIPLPPLEEQQRIVNRVNVILPLCDDLANK